MKWLYKLEYKHGHRYIPNLMKLIVFGMAFVYVLLMFSGNNADFLYSNMMLTRDGLFKGQIWRLVTFIFLPPLTQPIYVFISLYFYYFIGNSLEQYWGGFRFNLYYLFGTIGTILAMLISGYGTNVFLNLSLFLAFATVAPDTTFLLFFILPVKAKWMALGYVAISLFQIIASIVANPTTGVRDLVSLAFSLANYFLFFGRDLIDAVQNQIRIYKNRRNWRK